MLVNSKVKINLKELLFFETSRKPMTIIPLHKLPHSLTWSLKIISNTQFSFDIHLKKMSRILFVNFLLLISALQVFSAADNSNNAKIVCYYNSKSFGYEGEKTKFNRFLLIQISWQLIK